jgi:hypothetical protein
LPPASADAGIQHRCFKARIGADQHDGIGLSMPATVELKM